MALALFNGLRGVGARVPAALGGASQPNAGATPRCCRSSGRCGERRNRSASNGRRCRSVSARRCKARLALLTAPGATARLLRAAVAAPCTRSDVRMAVSRSCAAAADAASRRGAASRHADARRRQVHRGRQLEVRAPAVDMLERSRVSAASRCTAPPRRPVPPWSGEETRARATCVPTCAIGRPAAAPDAKRAVGAGGRGLSLAALNCRAPASS